MSLNDGTAIAVQKSLALNSELGVAGALRLRFGIFGNRTRKYSGIRDSRETFNGTCHGPGGPPVICGAMNMPASEMRVPVIQKACVEVGVHGMRNLYP